MRRFLFSICILLLTTPSLLAQTHTWGAGINGDWSDALRWTPNSVPNGAGTFPSITAVGINPYTVTMDLDVLLDQLDFITSDAELLVVGRTVTMNGLGQLGPGAGSVLNLHNSHWLGSGTLHNRTDVAVRGTSTIDHLLTEDTFRVLGSSSVGTANLTLNNVSTNTLDFEVTSEGAGFSSKLTIPPGARFDNAGTGSFTFASGAGGARTLEGDLRNSGSVAVNTATTMTAGLLEQLAGSLEVDPGILLNMTAGRDVDHQGGTISILGDLLQTSSTFTMSGGNVVGLLRKAQGTLDLADPGAGDFQMQGTTTLTGSISSSQTVRASGHSSTGNAVMTIPNPMTSQGNLNMDSIGAGFSSTVTMGGGAAFTNQGVVDVQIAAGGGRIWNGSFLNDSGGTVQMAANTTMNTGPFTNYGSWTVDAGATLTLPSGTTFTQESGTFQNDGSFLHTSGTDLFNGGTFNGTPELRHTDLHFGPGFASGFTADVTGTSTLHNDLGVNTTLNLLASSGTGNAVLTPASSLALNGQMDMTSVGAGFATTWDGGGTLLENFGTLRSLVGAGGGRTFRGDLDSHGTVSLQAGTTTFLDGTVRNFGAWTNDPTAAMTMTTDQVFELVSGTFDVGGK